MHTYTLSTTNVICECVRGKKKKANTPTFVNRNPEVTKKKKK